MLPPRNFLADASVNAVSLHAHPIASLDLEALGPSAGYVVPNAPDPWLDFALTEDTQALPEGVAGGEGLINAIDISDDTADLNGASNAITVQATATDVLGNVGSAEVIIPMA